MFRVEKPLNTFIITRFERVCLNCTFVCFVTLDSRHDVAPYTLFCLRSLAMYAVSRVAKLRLVPAADLFAPIAICSGQVIGTGSSQRNTKESSVKQEVACSRRMNGAFMMREVWI